MESASEALPSDYVSLLEKESAREALPSDYVSLLEKDYVSLLEKEDHSMIKNHIIDIPQEIDFMLSHKCCIYKVPERLRKLNPEAFTPHLISIGPFHHNDKKLKPMERQKQIYFHHFWKRLRSKVQDSALEKLKEYKNFLMENKHEISHHYSEKIHDIIGASENNFMNIMLMDSVFIMELFLRNWEKNGDYMFTKSWHFSGICRDLFLLENQLPFFVLEKLHGLCFPSVNGPRFLDLAHKYFNCRIQTNEQNRPKDVRHFTDLMRQTLRPSDPKFCSYEFKVQMSATQLKKAGITFENAHEKLEKKLKKKDLNLGRIQNLLQKLNMERISTARVEDLIVKKIDEKARTSRRKADDPIVEKLIEGRESLEGVENMSKITREEVGELVKLKEAGVSFKEIQDICLLNVEFKKADVLERLPCLSCFPCSNGVKARLQIPQFRVDDDTEYIFRNLIAYEQCHDLKEAYVCNYIYLLDCLIDTEDDVDLLVQSKAIDSMLGSNKELTELINNLCKNIDISVDCYSHIVKRLDKHYSNGWNHSIATLRSVYFNDLWRTSSTVVGVAVLVLTIVSLVRSVFS